jgi:hypothetical protein
MEIFKITLSRIPQFLLGTMTLIFLQHHCRKRPIALAPSMRSALDEGCSRTFQVKLATRRR